MAENIIPNTRLPDIEIYNGCYLDSLGVRQSGIIKLCTLLDGTTRVSVLDYSGNPVANATPTSCVDTENFDCFFDDSNTRFFGIYQYNEEGQFFGFNYFTADAAGNLIPYTPTSTPQPCETDYEAIETCYRARVDDPNPADDYSVGDIVMQIQWFNITSSPVLITTAYYNRTRGVEIATPPDLNNFASCYARNVISWEFCLEYDDGINPPVKFTRVFIKNLETDTVAIQNHDLITGIEIPIPEGAVVSECVYPDFRIWEQCLEYDDGANPPVRFTRVYIKELVTDTVTTQDHDTVTGLEITIPEGATVYECTFDLETWDECLQYDDGINPPVQFTRVFIKNLQTDITRYQNHDLITGDTIIIPNGATIVKCPFPPEIDTWKECLAYDDGINPPVRFTRVYVKNISDDITTTQDHDFITGADITVPEGAIVTDCIFPTEQFWASCLQYDDGVNPPVEFTRVFIKDLTTDTVRTQDHNSVTGGDITVPIGATVIECPDPGDLEVWESCLEYDDGINPPVKFTRVFIKNLTYDITTTQDHDRITGADITVPGGATVIECVINEERVWATCLEYDDGVNPPVEFTRIFIKDLATDITRTQDHDPITGADITVPGGATVIKCPIPGDLELWEKCLEYDDGVNPPVKFTRVFVKNLTYNTVITQDHDLITGADITVPGGATVIECPLPGDLEIWEKCLEYDDGVNPPVEFTRVYVKNLKTDTTTTQDHDIITGADIVVPPAASVVECALPGDLEIWVKCLEYTDGVNPPVEFTRVFVKNLSTNVTVTQDHDSITGADITVPGTATVVECPLPGDLEIWEKCLQYDDGVNPPVRFTRVFIKNLSTDALSTQDHNLITGADITVPGGATVIECPLPGDYEIWEQCLEYDDGVNPPVEFTRVYVKNLSTDSIFTQDHDRITGADITVPGGASIFACSLPGDVETWVKCLEYDDGVNPPVQFTRIFIKNLTTDITRTQDHDPITGADITVPGGATVTECPLPGDLELWEQCLEYDDGVNPPVEFTRVFVKNLTYGTIVTQDHDRITGADITVPGGAVVFQCSLPGDVETWEKCLQYDDGVNPPVQFTRVYVKNLTTDVTRTQDHDYITGADITVPVGATVTQCIEGQEEIWAQCLEYVDGVNPPVRFTRVFIKDLITESIRTQDHDYVTGADITVPGGATVTECALPGDLEIWERCLEYDDGVNPPVRFTRVFIKNLSTDVTITQDHNLVTGADITVPGGATVIECPLPVTQDELELWTKCLEYDDGVNPPVQFTRVYVKNLTTDVTETQDHDSITGADIVVPGAATVYECAVANSLEIWSQCLEYILGQQEPVRFTRIFVKNLTTDTTVSQDHDLITGADISIPGGAIIRECIADLELWTQCLEYVLGQQPPVRFTRVFVKDLDNEITVFQDHDLITGADIAVPGGATIRECINNTEIWEECLQYVLGAQDPVQFTRIYVKNLALETVYTQDHDPITGADITIPGGAVIEKCPVATEFADSEIWTQCLEYDDGINPIVQFTRVYIKNLSTDITITQDHDLITGADIIIPQGATVAECKVENTATWVECLEYSTDEITWTQFNRIFIKDLVLEEIRYQDHDIIEGDTILVPEPSSIRECSGTPTVTTYSACFMANGNQYRGAIYRQINPNTMEVISTIGIAHDGTVYSPIVEIICPEINAILPAISASKVINTPGPYFEGNTIEYTVTVTNISNVVVTNVIWTDTLSPVTIISDPDNLQTGANILVGNSASITYEYTITAADAAAGSVANYTDVYADFLLQANDSISITVGTPVGPPASGVWTENGGHFAPGDLPELFDNDLTNGNRLHQGLNNWVRGVFPTPYPIGTVVNVYWSNEQQNGNAPGDLLNIIVEFSNDGGATWPEAFVSPTETLPVTGNQWFNASPSFAWDAVRVLSGLDSTGRDPFVREIRINNIPN